MILIVQRKDLTVQLHEATYGDGRDGALSYNVGAGDVAKDDTLFATTFTVTGTGTLTAAHEAFAGVFWVVHALTSASIGAGSVMSRDNKVAGANGGTQQTTHGAAGNNGAAVLNINAATMHGGAVQDSGGAGGTGGAINTTGSVGTAGPNGPATRTLSGHVRSTTSGGAGGGGGGGGGGSLEAGGTGGTGSETPVGSGRMRRQFAVSPVSLSLGVEPSLLDQFYVNPGSGGGGGGGGGAGGSDGVQNGGNGGAGRQGGLGGGGIFLAAPTISGSGTIRCNGAGPAFGAGQNGSNGPNASAGGGGGGAGGGGGSGGSIVIVTNSGGLGGGITLQANGGLGSAGGNGGNGAAGRGNGAAGTAGGNGSAGVIEIYVVG